MNDKLQNIYQNIDREKKKLKQKIKKVKQRNREVIRKSVQISEISMRKIATEVDELDDEPGFNFGDHNVQDSVTEFKLFMNELKSENTPKTNNLDSLSQKISKAEKFFEKIEQAKRKNESEKNPHRRQHFPYLWYETELSQCCFTISGNKINLSSLAKLVVTIPIQRAV